MHVEIHQKRRELQMDLNRFHEQIDTRKDHCKIFLADRIKSASCVLEEQLQQAEVDGAEVDKARNELDRLQNLFNLLRSQPLISVLNVEDSTMDFNAPSLVFPSVKVEGFDWMENFYLENTVEVMEYSDQPKVDINESTIHQRSTGNYILDS